MGKVNRYSVCIFDFNGYTQPGHFPISMWADYEHGHVTFGGDWSDIPDWRIDYEPTEEEVIEHVRKWEETCKTNSE